MSLTSLEQNSPTSVMSSEFNEDFFDAIIERLKAQKALSHDSFVKNMPFFNLSSISRESQVKELFQDISDPNTYKSLIKNIISLPEDKNPDMITKRLSAMQVMGFAQIVLYKVLLCPDENCPNRPREIATHNQYKDYEYECPFYHHDKDRRRIVLTPKIEEEFTYKANYSEDRKNLGEKGKCSQNYFESMFHPLYYKMFKCKREYCNFSQCCPFYHCEDEKKTWDKIFSNFIRKDRISYVKDKQKYYEHASKNPQTRILRAGSDQFSTSTKSTNSGNATPETPKNRNYRNRQNTYSYSYSKTPKYQPQTSPKNKSINEWNENVQFKVQKQQKQGTQSARKGSQESCESGSPDDFAHYYERREAVINRAC